MTNLIRFHKNEIEPWDLLFRNFFDTDNFFLPETQVNEKYPIDIFEDENSLNFEIAVAGLDKQDINIEQCDGVLRVIYDKVQDDDQSNKNYIKKRITKKSFNFGWKISEKFDLANINANMDKGILKISIPRAEEKQPDKQVIKIN